jgi:hypothetical protein
MDAEKALRNETYRDRLALRDPLFSNVYCNNILACFGSIYRTQALFIYSALDIGLDMRNPQVKI